MTESSLLSGKILRILCHLYEKVETLEAFANVIVSSQSSSDAGAVVQSGDSASYLSLLKSTVVCTPFKARSLPKSWMLQQHSRQDEVILRVIERIRQREGRSSTNLLVMGYRLMSDDPDAQISSSRSIEYRIPNSNTSRLHYTPWKLLLSRIGDDAMEFLLETRTVFVPAVSTCYVQLTGSPMYELWPFHRYCAQNQRNPTTQKLCTSLLNDSKCKLRKRQRRRKNRIKQNTSSKEISNSITLQRASDDKFSKPSAAVVREKNIQKFGEKQQLETEVEDMHGVSNTAGKRKCSETEIGDCYLLKKRKVEMDLEKEQQRISESVPVAGSECVGHVQNPGLLMDPHHQKTLQVENFSQQSTSVNFESRKRRRKRKGKLHDGNRDEHGQKVVAFDHRLVIERTPMFFSRDFAEKYPPRYVLFDSNTNNHMKLIDDILSVKISVFSGVGEVSEYDSEVKQKLLNIIQLIIGNHKLCRYRYLLQHHCSISHYYVEETCPKETGYMTMKPAPKLNVPVYHRVKKPSSCVSDTVHVQQRCVQPPKKTSDLLNVGHLLEQHCSQRSVFLFVRACCLQVIPTQLFGSTLNRNKFFRNVQKFIGMGRHEQLCLGQLMKSMQVTRCSWMKGMRSNYKRLQLLAKVLSWLLKAFILPLVMSYFYVTDSTSYRNKMFYYRKSLWRKIHQKVRE